MVCVMSSAANSINTAVVTQGKAKMGEIGVRQRYKCRKYHFPSYFSFVKILYRNPSYKSQTKRYCGHYTVARKI